MTGGRPPPGRKDEAGMVTAELAFGALFAAGFLVVVAWFIALLMVWTSCQSVAAEVARQEARGDVQASRRAQGARPPGATVEVTRNGPVVRVRVELDARPWASWLPSVPLSASADVLAEGG